MENVNDWLKPELIGFVVGFIFLLVEFIGPGFIIFFFGIGAWIVAVVCLLLEISLNTQLTIFLVSSLLLLLFLRKWVKTIFIGRIDSKQTKDDIYEEFAGKKAVVTQEIKPNVNGKVEFHGS